LAAGPDGWSVVYRDAQGCIRYCQQNTDLGDPANWLQGLVEQQGWNGVPCSLVLHPLYYQVLLTEKPAVAADELLDAVRWQIKDLLDFSVEQAVIDFFPLPDDAYRGRKSMLYAVAMRKTSLEAIVAPVEASGLALGCVEIAELALHKFAIEVPAGRGGSAFVHMLESEGFINLLEQGSIYLSRSLDVGLAAFRDVGNSGELDNLLLEIQRSLDFYESQLGKGIIANLYYSPASEEMAPVATHLANLLGLDVQPLDLSRYLVGSEVDAADASRCVLALAASLTVDEVSSAAR
jgi:MSHA biogenesis protein MshI